METATFGGGCFWCMDAICRRLKGITTVTTGYSGGWKENPTMHDVYGGKSGHVECVQIAFDPSVISYRHLLEIFFHLHDPTVTTQPGTLDSGPEYRSSVFYHNNEQKQAVESEIQELEQSGKYPAPIITAVLPYKNFYPAEISHQAFYEKNSYHPYCQAIIDPKIQKLLQMYRKDVKQEYVNS